MKFEERKILLKDGRTCVLKPNSPEYAQEMLDMFSADDGLSAAEKIPALKAYVETKLGEPGIGKLVDLLEKLAKEANDNDTLKWSEESRSKLANNDSANDKVGKTEGSESYEMRLRRELDGHGVEVRAERLPDALLA